MSFLKCLEYDPDHFGANLNIANTLIEFDLFLESIPYYQRCIKKKPESVSAQFGLMIALK